MSVKRIRATKGFKDLEMSGDPIPVGWLQETGDWVHLVVRMGDGYKAFVSVPSGAINRFPEYFESYDRK